MLKSQNCSEAITVDSSNMQINIINTHDMLSKIIKQFSHLIQNIIKVHVILHEAPQILQVQALSQFQKKVKCSSLNINTDDDFCFKQHIPNMQNTSMSFNTLKRFSCRLVQILLAAKQRAQSSEAFSQLKALITKLEQSILLLQDKANLTTFLNQIYQSFLSHKCALSRKVTKPKIIASNQHSSTVCGDKHKKLCSTMRQPNFRLKSFQVEPEQQRKVKKLIAGLNCRFKTLDCLDLDYSYFRSSYFQAKNINNQDDYFQQYCERNQQIQGQILHYSQQYKDYLRRKQKRKTERAIRQINLKLNQTKTFYQQHQNETKQKNNSLLVDRRGSLRIGNWASNNKQKVNGVYYKKFDNMKYTQNSIFYDADKQVNEQTNQKQTKRIKYQMKNVVICANQIRNESGISIRSINFKKTVRNFDLSNKKLSNHQDQPGHKNLRRLSSVNVS